MATANQIKYRMGQAKKKLTKLNKDVTATKAKIKKLESAHKKAKAASKSKIVHRTVTSFYSPASFPREMGYRVVVKKATAKKKAAAKKKAIKK